MSRSRSTSPHFDSDIEEGTDKRASAVSSVSSDDTEESVSGGFLGWLGGTLRRGGRKKNNRTSQTAWERSISKIKDEKLKGYDLVKEIYSHPDRNDAAFLQEVTELGGAVACWLTIHNCKVKVEADRQQLIEAADVLVRICTEVPEGGEIAGNMLDAECCSSLLHVAGARAIVDADSDVSPDEASPRRRNRKKRSVSPRSRRRAPTHLPVPEDKVRASLLAAALLAPFAVQQKLHFEDTFLSILTTEPGPMTERQCALFFTDFSTHSSHAKDVFEDLRFETLFRWAKSDDPGLKSAASCIIANLTVEKELQKALIHDGGLTVLIKMVGAKDNHEFKMHAARGLANLSVIEEAHVVLAERAVVTILCDILTTETHDAEVQDFSSEQAASLVESAVKCLSRLLVSKKVGKEACTLVRDRPGMLKMLETYSNDKETPLSPRATIHAETAFKVLNKPSGKLTGEHKKRAQMMTLRRPSYGDLSEWNVEAATTEPAAPEPTALSMLHQLPPESPRGRSKEKNRGVSKAARRDMSPSRVPGDVPLRSMKGKKGSTKLK